MESMCGKERISNILHRKPVDRIGVYEHFWSNTREEWSAKGKIKPDENLVDHFNYDLDACWCFNLVIDQDYQPQTIAEDEDTITTLDGNGATLRHHKRRDTTPEHIDFSVVDRQGWEKRKPLLRAEDRRINFDAYRKMKEYCHSQNRFFCWSGVNVFELMHPVCGHEHMLMGMALDPDWIKDMVDTYARLTIDLMEILFAREGTPDGIWFYEDMGFKNKPFMSPDMYREIIQPGHKKTIDYCKSRGLPVIMHSCGYVEPLLPGMIEAGIDCLQVIEVKAGMDLLKLHRDYGDRLSFMGGIDVRTLYSNNRQTIYQELKNKIPIVKQGYGYALHSDHSIPNTVDYESYVYFLQQGLELGTYS